MAPHHANAFPACKQAVQHQEPSQLAAGPFHWLGLFWAFLYLDRLGTSVSAWTASFTAGMKEKRYFSSFMALEINSEDSYLHRINMRNIPVEVLLIELETYCHLYPLFKKVITHVIILF